MPRPCNSDNEIVLFAGNRIYLREIAGFTDQRTAFTHAQGAILQSRDYNLRVERGGNSAYTQG